MAKKPLPVDILPYRMSEAEKKILRDAEIMRDIWKTASESVTSTFCSPEEPALALLEIERCANQLAIQKGYKAFNHDVFREAVVVKQMQGAFEDGQRNLLWKMRIANTPKLALLRSQRVNGWTLLSRFEIDVWRGVYRFVLRNRGCYDPSLSFKELREKFPLTDDELSATVQFARWIACSKNDNSAPVFSAYTESIIKILLYANSRSG